MLLSLDRELARLAKAKLSPHGVVALKAVRSYYDQLETITNNNAIVSLAMVMQQLLIRIAKYNLGLYPNSAAHKIAIAQPAMVEELIAYEKYFEIVKRLYG